MKSQSYNNYSIRHSNLFLSPKSAAYISLLKSNIWQEYKDPIRLLGCYYGRPPEFNFINKCQELFFTTNNRFENRQMTILFTLTNFPKISMRWMVRQMYVIPCLYSFLLVGIATTRAILVLMYLSCTHPSLDDTLAPASILLTVVTISDLLFFSLVGTHQLFVNYKATFDIQITNRVSVDMSELDVPA